MVALDLGASRNPALALAGLVRASREGGLQDRVTPRPVLRLESASEPVAYGMFFGAGAICRAIELTHRRFPKGRAQGTLGGSLVTGTLLAQVVRGRRAGLLTPDKVELTLDGRGIGAESYVAVIATTLQRLFFRLRPFWGEGPGVIRVTTVASGTRGLGRALPRILRGHPPAAATPGLDSRNAEDARFRLDCDIVLDGELFGPRPDRVVRLTAPEHVEFLRA